MDWQLVASYFTVKSTDICYSVSDSGKCESGMDMVAKGKGGFSVPKIQMAVGLHYLTIPPKSTILHRKK